MKLFRSLLILSLAFILLGSSALAQSFHFTVTADCREHKHRLDKVLDAISDELGGEPEFHVSCGDIDRTVEATRDEFNDHFGVDFLWYPIVGNHEVDNPLEGNPDIAWICDEYNTGHDGRTALKNYTNQDGPATCLETTYTLEHENAYIIALNEYWDGISDIGFGGEHANGQICTALLTWLEDRLESNTQPFIFVFGHEPAYPQNRHLHDSLNANETTRDEFWQLLDDYGVQAYFCAHTHIYSTYQEPGYGAWQFDVGNSGNESYGPDGEEFLDEGQTFLDVEVRDDRAVVNVYRNNNTDTWSLYESITLWPELPSCPVLYSWNGERYVREGYIFTRTHCPQSEYYQQLLTNHPVALQEDTLVFKIKEINGEISYINSIKMFYTNIQNNDKKWTELNLISAIHDPVGDISEILKEKDDKRVYTVPGDEILLTYVAPSEGLRGIRFKCVSSGYYLWSNQTWCEVLKLGPPITFQPGDTVTLKAKINNVSTEPLPDDALVCFDVKGSNWSVTKAGYVSAASLPPASPQWYSWDVTVPNYFPAGTMTYEASVWIGESDITLSKGRGALTKDNLSDKSATCR